ncbi:short-chain alcohol dehydrogenase [Shewanella psychrophila]|uniref:Short-chain alcohol dehydrogenase n=1 Tax=Shewanella psychrophila TaxID=225848 RepID=A0A1S6HI97_9GAMM|nr:SDR family oxidoreductase [Shewanella psychrophila]AQS35235.1 short-chain alcohol dehydrogenase [Shewanella psychrophila]
MKKLVVITGASSGFGSAIARRLNALDYPLLLIARRLEPMEDLKLSNTICKAVDVCDAEGFKNAIIEAEAIYGEVETLINNAGIMLLSELDSQDPKEWEAMINVNLKGVLNGMEIVISKMKKRQSGTIVNMSSLAGQKTYEFHAAYCATKYAVHGLTEATRWELAPYNVRVIEISPGAAETELVSHISVPAVQKDYKDWKESIGGVISADDVASAVEFAVELPQSVCIRDLKIAPTKQQN